ncbi:sushi domain protein [Dictyocaulus viviparus]|uniref:Sushi domain protein n=1 Tax=Dictyocaulus viviparus TaxID=29172 RepID=A0A0D8XNM4_DICVI|nr:sushi domain protein [Dictyocaulus viviparus]
MNADLDGLLLPCAKLLTPQNGDIVYSQEPSYPSGTRAKLLCDIGYHANGTTIATCQNGLWSPLKLGRCELTSPCSIGVPSVIHGSISYSNGDRLGPWPIGSTASLLCNTGYKSTGITKSTCTGRGQWLPKSLGECQSIDDSSCPALPLIIGGKITYSDKMLPPYPTGTTVTLSCYPGFKLSGLRTAICLGNKWSSDIGSCTLESLQRHPSEAVFVEKKAEKLEMRCPAPTTSAFGEINFSTTSRNSSGFVSGTTAELRCNFGRSIIGPSFSTCYQGMFRPILGKCIDDREDVLSSVCLPLSTPINGRITYIQAGRQNNFEIGTTALLDCNESYAVTGQPTVLCTKDGWQPDNGLGQCDPTDTIN